MKEHTQYIIIAGPPRSGTTSLFTYLSEHPQICGSDIKETYHFYPESSDQKVSPLADYRRHFQHCDRPAYYLEATAAYFFGAGRVAESIRQELGDPKIIFCFRDPADRLISYFRHKQMVGHYPKELTIESFLELPPHPNERGLSSGYYYEYLQEWFHVFEPHDIMVLFFEELQQDPAGLLQRVARWLGIDAYVFEGRNYSVENRGALYKNKLFHQTARAVNSRLETFFRRHHALKRLLRRTYYLLNEAEDLPVVQPSTLAHLREHYRPYNEHLCEFLSAQGYEIRGWLVAYTNKE